MSTPSLVFHQRTPPSPTIPLEPDFPSPPVMRPFPPNTRSQPISPSLSRSNGSDITSVSDTIRPFAHAHPQPGPSVGRASTPGITFGSTASSSATVTAPATTHADQSSTTITPPRFKFLGRQNPMDRTNTATAASSATGPSFPPINDHAMLLDPPESYIFGPGFSRAAVPAGEPRLSGGYTPRTNRGPSDIASPLSTSTGPEAYRRPQSGETSDPPHLQAFEQRASLSSGWLNELGTMRRGLPPAVSRTSSGSERAPSPRLSPPPPNYPMHFPIAHAGAPPVRPRIGFPAAPVAIPPAPQSSAPVEPPPRSGIADLFFAYGITGPQWERGADGATSPLQTATVGSAVSAVPSVPPPRPSRSMISDLYHDREDFSPHRLGRRSREQAEERTDRPNPTEAFGAIRPTSQLHRDRLARADAFRLRSGQLDPLVPAGQWTRPPYFGDHFLSTDLQGESRGRSSATDVSSRQGRFALDDDRDLRSRIRRRLSISDTDSVGGREGGSEIGTWNRDVQDAIGRRVAGDQPHSPASAARRHREISGPYSRARPVAERNGIPERQRAPWQNADWQIGMPWRPYDIIHVDTIGSEPRDSAQLPLPTTFGWRSHFAPGFPSSTTAQPTMRRAHSPSMYSERSVETFRAGNNASPGAPFSLPADMTEVFNGTGMDDEDMEEELPIVPPAFTAGTEFFGSYWPPYGLDPGAYPARLAPHEMLEQIRFTTEMDQAERVRLARPIVKGIVRWPSSARRRAAETVIENKPWGDMESNEEMERDVCCSVCHDEVG